MRFWAKKVFLADCDSPIRRPESAVFKNQTCVSEGFDGYVLGSGPPICDIYPIAPHKPVISAQKRKKWAFNRVLPMILGQILMNFDVVIFFDFRVAMAWIVYWGCFKVVFEPLQPINRKI